MTKYYWEAENQNLSFQHFVITRLNIDWNISRPKKDRNNLDFLNYRLDIFEKTCYPSVNAQTTNNFIWLLLLDTETPSPVKERIAKYNSNPQLQTVFIPSKNTCLTTLRNEIKAQLNDSTQYIITTNLDSDDIIHNHFIANVQRQFKKQEFEFINFPFGYLYNLKLQKLYLREWLHSPIYTLIETRGKKDDFQSALTYQHHEISQYDIRQIVTKPMWLMTAHQENVRTSFDVSASWQPVSRMENSFTHLINFPSKSRSRELQEMLKEIKQVIMSTRKVDTFSVKMRKSVNIFFPFLIRLVRKVQYN